MVGIESRFDHVSGRFNQFYDLKIKLRKIKEVPFFGIGIFGSVCRMYTSDIFVLISVSPS